GEKHIQNLRTTPDIDEKLVTIDPILKNATYGDIVEVTIKDGDKVLSVSKANATEALEIPISNQKLWSPESPFLYRMTVKLISDGKEVDQVESYFAMRKIAKKRDAHGIVRMQLNNKDYFQFGPLDQGWWPDGLYTAPTDQALKYDIVKTKDRKSTRLNSSHVKISYAVFC